MDANFAFSLWNNRFDPRDPDEITDYVYFDVKLVSNRFVNNTVEVNITEVPLHRCNENDKFYEPVHGQEDF